MDVPPQSFQHANRSGRSILTTLYLFSAFLSIAFGEEGTAPRSPVNLNSNMKIVSWRGLDFPAALVRAEDDAVLLFASMDPPEWYWRSLCDNV